jgi:hypothetical protein
MGRNKDTAIGALLTQRNVEDAARVANIGTQTLSRWLEDPEFATAYREARHATQRQTIGRLQHASAAMVSALLKVMHDPNAPASARLKAADCVLKHARRASEAEEMGARVAALKHAKEAAKQARRANGDDAASADEHGSSQLKGHGAKFPRKCEAAIVALLTQRNVPEAARATGISTPTLYRWMQEAEFAAAYLVARMAAFGRAGARLQQASGDAVTTLLNIAGDPRTTPGMRVRAVSIAFTHAHDAVEEDIEACVAELDCARAVLTVLQGDRQIFGEIARPRPRIAA